MNWAYVSSNTLFTPDYDTPAWDNLVRDNKACGHKYCHSYQCHRNTATDATEYWSSTAPSRWHCQHSNNIFQGFYCPELLEFKDVLLACVNICFTGCPILLWLFIATQTHPWLDEFLQLLKMTSDWKILQWLKMKSALTLFLFLFAIFMNLKTGKWRLTIIYRDKSGWRDMWALA